MSARTDIDFEEFRKLLRGERARILGLHREQRTDMLEEAGDLPSDVPTADADEPADVGAEMADYDRDFALDENLKGELREIDRALSRLDDGTYGLCIVTGAPIPLERLRALPWATMTVEAAEQAVQ